MNLTLPILFVHITTAQRDDYGYYGEVTRFWKEVPFGFYAVVGGATDGHARIRPMNS